MIHKPSIQSEAIRADLQRDCVSVGYTPGDAGRLAGRIMDGNLFPGLAVDLRGGRLRSSAHDFPRPGEVAR